jgi:AcrR family transcriptional regulator
MEMKERIQKKADELFTRYGIRSITMDEIASQLGMSKKTIYQYFSDKDELVDAVIANVIEYSRECCEKDRLEADNAIDEVFKALGMMFDLERYHPRTYKRFLDHKNKYLYHTIILNLERGIREELFRPEMKLEIIARFRLESMMLAFNPEVFKESKATLAELHQEILEHFLFAASSLKGHKLIIKYKEERIKKAKQYETLSSSRHK